MFRPVPAIVGATGSGKSAVAHQLAARASVQLINCDPFQSYRGLYIGSARPEAPDDQLYKMLDVFDPDESINAVRFATLVHQQIDQAFAQGKVPVLVSGSGFYLQVISQALDPLPDHDDTAVSRQQPISCFGLWAQGGHYEQHLALRLQKMLAAGWQQEAQELSQRWGIEAPALRALGYRELCTQDTDPALLLIQTRRYAKRQRTWFRGKPIRWFLWRDQDSLLSSLLQYIDGTFR